MQNATGRIKNKKKILKRKGALRRKIYLKTLAKKRERNAKRNPFKSQSSLGRTTPTRRTRDVRKAFVPENSVLRVKIRNTA